MPCAISRSHGRTRQSAAVKRRGRDRTALYRLDCRSHRQDAAFAGIPLVALRGGGGESGAICFYRSQSGFHSGIVVQRVAVFTAAIRNSIDGRADRANCILDANIVFNIRPRFMVRCTGGVPLVNSNQIPDDSKAKTICAEGANNPYLFRREPGHVPALNIDGRCDRLEVIWIYTRRIAAKVVNHFSDGDRSPMFFVRNPMRSDVSATDSDESVSAPIFSSVPNPTSGLLIDCVGVWVFKALGIRRARQIVRC